MIAQVSACQHGTATLLLQKTQLEIDRYGFFGVDTDAHISPIDAPIADTNISEIFKSCFLLHYQKYNVFYALPFFS